MIYWACLFAGSLLGLIDSGQGLLSNNVLHDRSGFEDDADSAKKRLLYRARYYDRIQGM